LRQGIRWQSWCTRLVPPKIGAIRITYPTDICGRCWWLPPFALIFSCLWLDSRFFWLIFGNGHFPVGPSKMLPKSKGVFHWANGTLVKALHAMLSPSPCSKCFSSAHTRPFYPNPIIARTVITQDTPIELSIPTPFSVPFHGMTQSWLSNFSSCRSGCFTNCGGAKDH